MIDITKSTDTAVVRYQSPIRFFEQYSIDYNHISTTDFFILEIQKAFSAHPSATIEIEGISYTESQLTAEVCNPQFGKRLPYHLSIWEKKGLLKFLEQDIVQLREAARFWHSLVNDAGFVEFVSPYFVSPYQTAMDNWLSQPAFDSAARWLSFLNFMTADDQQKALSVVCDFIEKSTAFFNNSTFTDCRLDSLRPWTEQNWNIFMNALPSSLYGYRNNLAKAILSFVNKIYKTNLENAFLIILRLSKVEYLDQQIAMEVNQLHKPLSVAYYQKQEAERGYNDAEENDSSAFGSIRVLLTIISLIISLVSLMSKCS